METWAHAQEVYDVLGVKRIDTDRIKNIATLGVNTFGWSFVCRGLKAPGNTPYVKLTAPSGDTWEWNEPSEENRIEGAATEFCQVVTQVRNIADTDLTVKGDIGTQWMSIAQCFAGPPEEPPPLPDRGDLSPRTAPRPPGRQGRDLCKLEGGEWSPGRIRSWPPVPRLGSGGFRTCKEGSRCPGPLRQGRRR